MANTPTAQLVTAIDDARAALTEFDKLHSDLETARMTARQKIAALRALLEQVDQSEPPAPVE